jgi:hypothetical protein
MTPSERAKIVERHALAIEETMFAEHELPLDADLHAKYVATAEHALTVSGLIEGVEALDLFANSAARLLDSELDDDLQFVRIDNLRRARVARRKVMDG